MPPLLVAALVIGAVLLLPKRKSGNVIIQSSPVNGGTGITTGFAPPYIQASPVVSPAGLQTNAPSPASSGVPLFASLAHAFGSGPAVSTPGMSAPSFYNAGQKRVTNFMTQVPPLKSYGCGGGCSGCAGNGASPARSDCRASKSRSQDAGCMAASRGQQLQNTPLDVLKKWASNVLSNPNANSFTNGQQNVLAMQQNNPGGEDVTIPASPQLTHIGLTLDGSY